MTRIQISGTGLFTPSEVLTNDELVESFIKYVDEFNYKNKGEGYVNESILLIKHDKLEVHEILSEK